MEDVGREGGMCSEGWVMSWVSDLEQNELTAVIKKGEVVAVFTVMSKGEPGVGNHLN